VTSATVARVRIDDERAGSPSSSIQTYKQSWISTAPTTTTTTAKGESYCIEEETIFGRRGAGNCFIMSHTATRGSSWPYMDFKLFVTSVPGVELCPYMGNGRDLSIYGETATPRVFGVHKMS
jgi:hypothetical protein